MELALHRPVILDQVPPGQFQWRLQWNTEQPHALEEALREQLGLRLRPERRLLPVLTVDPLEAEESAN